MSDGYRDDGTGTEDWCVTRITDQIAAWPDLPSSLGSDAFYRHMSAAYSQRLRTTAEALRAATTWAAPMRDAPKSARPAWFDDARAILARLKQEGLA